MKEQYACNVNCTHYYSKFNNCVFYLDLATGMCDTASYNHNINRFCPYAKENVLLGEYRDDEAHPTEKGDPKCCENCGYYNEDRDNQPCNTCAGFSNWEAGTTEKGGAE